MPTTKHKGSPSGPYALTKHEVDLVYGVGANTFTTQNVAVPGLRTTDIVAVNSTTALGPRTITARVSAADTLQVTIGNPGGALSGPAVGFIVGVMKFTG